MTAAEATPPLEEISAMLAAAQRETQRLREMVTALYLEVGALKAAANPVWEGHDDTGEGADAAAHAEMAPQHFIGSPSTGDRRGHDPWMPAASRYPVSSRDHSEPPQMPPGMTTSATSEPWIRTC